MEDEKLEESSEQRRKERCCLQAEVIQKAPECVVDERMSQSKGVKDKNLKKPVEGWSTEEKKKQPSSCLEEDTEEMRKWRDMGQEEMDQCWKNLAERMEAEVLDKYKVEDSSREAYRGTGNTLVWRLVRRCKNIE